MNHMQDHATYHGCTLIMHIMLYDLLFAMPNIDFMQATYRGSESASFMKYDLEQSETAFQATFHDMGSLEQKGNWCRCW